MKPGDVVFYKGTSFISKVICKLTKSPYSHVALAIDDKRIVEADLFIKTRITELKYENITIMRADLTEEQRRRVVDFARYLVGRSYDYLSVFLWLLRLTFNINSKGLFNNANRLYCTELIDRCYHYAGIDLVPDRETGDVLPIDLYRSPLLHEVNEGV